MNSTIRIDENVRITAVVMVLLLLSGALLFPGKFYSYLKYFTKES
tara:strand:+ start:430 stop:564 length:135 start_codon:yes stop_codon:yes gene_type:complete